MFGFMINYYRKCGFGLNLDAGEHRGTGVSWEGRNSSSSRASKYAHSWRRAQCQWQGEILDPVEPMWKVGVRMRIIVSMSSFRNQNICRIGSGRVS